MCPDFTAGARNHTVGKWHVRRMSQKNTHRILLGFIQSFDRVVKGFCLGPSLAVLLIVHLRNYVASCMKQRPCKGPNVVGHGVTFPRMWFEAFTVLPLDVYVPILDHCLGVGVSAPAPVEEDIGVAPLLLAYAHNS